MNFDDRMIERDLEEALGNDGPSADLRERLLAATGAQTGARSASEGAVASHRPSENAGPAKVIPMRPRRMTAPVPKRSRAPAWIAAAAAVLIAVGLIGLAAYQPQPEQEASASAANEPVTPKGTVNNPVATPSANTPAPVPAPEAPRVPAPGPEGNEPAPQPAPQPTPEPKPGPAPEPAPQPQPKPEEVVEQPKPEPKPEGTEAKPEPAPQPVKVAALLLGGEKLKCRRGESEPWADYAGGEIHYGLQLKAARPAELRLNDGALLRFDGELELRVDAATVQAVLLARRSELYLDNAGCSALVIRVGDLACSALGVVHAEHEGTAVGLACFEGRVDHGAQQLKAGQQAKLGDKGLGKATDIKGARPSLVAQAGPRVLVRGDFDDLGGIAKASGDNPDVTTALGDLAVLAGATLRLRYRVTGGKALYVQLQKSAGDTQYGKWIPLAKVGDWQELEIPLSDLARDDNKGQGAPVIGEILRTLRVFAQDGQSPTLEVDWYEVSRRANQE